MAKFEKVSKFAEVDINLPVRKTADSAGYDMEVAEDIIIPSYYFLMEQMKKIHSPKKMLEDKGIVNESITLEDLGALTKENKIKPTLVSTGMKC